MNKTRKNTIKTNELSEMRTYTLNGYEQKILIDGKKKENTIVIFLHGGPGSPIPFSAGQPGNVPGNYGKCHNGILGSAWMRN